MTAWPAAATRVAGVIGCPVRHSLSPVIHNAAFRALDLDWVFLAFEVPVGKAITAMAGARALGLEGLSVTTPHKEAVLPALDRLSPTARRLGAVNAVHRLGDDLLGENTDGAGFIGALRHDEGFDPAGKRCVVVGAGGAARAVVLALAEAGAVRVEVLNRTQRRAEWAVELAGAAGAVGTEAGVMDADLVVNATPVGMAGLPDADATPIDPELLGSGQLVVDLVYFPPRTPLLVAARRRGAVAVSGLGMLVHQAAYAFRLWTGEEPPLEAMSAAALAALTGPGPEAADGVRPDRGRTR